MVVNNACKAGKWFGKSMLDFVGHKDCVLSIGISRDGQWVVSGLKDCGVQVWGKNEWAQLMFVRVWTILTQVGSSSSLLY